MPIIATNGRLRRFVARGAREQTRVSTILRRSRGTQQPRSKVSHGVFDDSCVESIESRGGCTVFRALLVRNASVPAPRQTLAGLMQKTRSVFRHVQHLKFAHVKRVYP